MHYYNFLLFVKLHQDRLMTLIKNMNKILLLLILAAIQVLGQDLSVKIIGENVSTIHGEQGISPLSDGYVIGNGLEEKPHSLKLVKIDKTGKIVWTKIYSFDKSDNQIGVYDLIGVSDGGIVVVGRFDIAGVFVMKVNASGTVLWSQLLHSDLGVFSVKELEDNTLFLTLRDHANPVHVKMNQDGEVIRSFVWTNSKSEWLHDITIEKDTALIVYDQGVVMSMNWQTEQIYWARKYTSGLGFAMNRCKNGDLIGTAVQKAFSGNLAVFRTDKDGKLKWAKELLFRDNSPKKHYFDHTRLHMISEDSMGNIVVLSNSEGGLVGTLLISLDASGNYLANTKINSTQNVIKEINKEQFILSGFVRSANPGIFQLRHFNDRTECDSILNPFVHDGTDSLLSLNETITFANHTLKQERLDIQTETVTEFTAPYCNNNPTGLSQTYMSVVIDVFPNPCNDVLKITSGYTIEAVRVFDPLGKEVIYKRGDVKELTMIGLERGLYHCLVYSGARVTSKTFVKE